MKRMITILALASLPAITACGRQPTAANVTAEDLNQLRTPDAEIMAPTNDMLAGSNEAASASTPAPGAAASNAHNLVAPRPKADAHPAAPRERTAPPPNTSPTHADPHAGHDMGNMSGMNMSH